MFSKVIFLEQFTNVIKIHTIQKIENEVFEFNII